MEAGHPLEVLLSVSLVGELLEHHLDILSLVALLDAVLVVAHKHPHVIALVVLVLALTQPHDGGRLGRRQIHHVLELERTDLLAQLLEIKRSEPLASQVGHPGAGGRAEGLVSAGGRAVGREC